MASIRSPLPLIWFALMMSIVLYGVIALVMTPVGGQPFDAPFSHPIILMLHIAGIGMFVMSFVLSSILMKRSNDVRTPMIIRWAMIESAAVLGLMAAFIGNDLRLFLPLGALAIAGMLLAYPRSDGGLAVPADRR
jgi:F0F1-type ATP synthase membrane subunit c/vacuolar-type H+-ATPase subunit K